MSISARLQALYLMRISRQQTADPALFLHFDPTPRDLRTWFWPVTDDGQRVTPSDLADYRITHQFRAPSCLCGCKTNNASYAETAIYIAKDGPYSGEYVVGCASDSCGYLICVERMYTKVGLMLRRYLDRTGPAPPPILYLPRDDRPRPRAINPQRMFAYIPVYERPIRGPETVLDKLLTLDSWGRAGLLETEFRELFAKCLCGLVMTRRVFPDHVCAVAPVVKGPPIVIDLTSDSEDSF